MAFEAVHQAAKTMRGFERSWFVAGGWALDLFLARETRAHEDLEIAIFRRDQESLWRHLAGWSLEKVERGTRTPWRGEWLAPPVHEIHGRRADEARELEFLLDEAWAETWRFRRNLAVTKPITEISLRTPDGVPFLAPEIVLLYKARNARPRDEADFHAALPALDASRCRWLREALEATHPGHAWGPRL